MDKRARESTLEKLKTWPNKRPRREEYFEARFL
jgi:hypothetical protein